MDGLPETEVRFLFLLRGVLEWKGMRHTLRDIITPLLPPGAVFEVTVPERDGLGDYATNAAFAAAKINGTSPRDEAASLASSLVAYPTLIEKAEVAGSGFVNITLAEGAFRAVVEEVLRLGSAYGPETLHESRRERIQVEFISANPTGPLTLANGRGGFLGDVIANVLMAVGHQVEREYYVNDTGNQIEVLGKSMLAALGIRPFEDEFYQGDYVRVWADAHQELVRKYGDDPHGLGRQAAADFLGLIKSVVEGRAGILFDRYTSEHDDIRAKQYPTKALELFRKVGAVYEADGATWLKTTAYGDDKDRVLIMKTGEPTYFLADAGHYLETVERGFTRKVNILGPDHYGYVSRIQAAAKLVGLPRSEVIITQAVRLLEGGEEVKMSKRAGSFIAFNALVEQVEPDAARFLFLSVAPESHMDFDLALAAERSMKNPVYYVQYAYVRAVKVLEKFGDEPGAGTPLEALATPRDRKLMRLLAEYPSMVEDTAADYRVHRLTQYAASLARAVHDWYEAERVVGELPEVARARAALLAATKIVLENLFSVIGITAPSEM
jgi:arginyl-tRNA synthetase